MPNSGRSPDLGQGPDPAPQPQMARGWVPSEPLKPVGRQGPTHPDWAQMGLDLGRGPAVAGQHHLPSSKKLVIPYLATAITGWSSRSCRLPHGQDLRPNPREATIRVVGSFSRIQQLVAAGPPPPPQARPAVAGLHAATAAAAPPRPCEHGAQAQRVRPTP
jgi:hypothetical protein